MVPVADGLDGGFICVGGGQLRQGNRHIRNLQIRPHYQQLTLAGARQMRVSAPVFVRAEVSRELTREKHERLFIALAPLFSPLMWAPRE